MQLSVREILVAAAVRIEQEEDSYSCHAIGNVPGQRRDRQAALSFYIDLFRPDSPRPEGHAWGDSEPANAGNGWELDDYDVRVVALCLAAAVAESSLK